MNRATPRPAIVSGDKALIPLGKNAKGGYAIVDKEYEYLANEAWRKTHWGYAIRSRDKALLHRVILDAPRGKVVDHINGDPLDNRSTNIRLCDQRDNAKNQKARKNKTGYKGVYKKANKYVARIRNNYQYIHIGIYKTAKEASEAYNKKAIELHGEYARLNHG